MSCYVGVDIGGTKSAAVLLGADGMEIARDWNEHGEAAPMRVSEIVIDSVERITTGAGLSPSDIDAVGIAVAGLVGVDQSTLVNGAKLGVRDLNLGVNLRDRFGVRVLVENDANATLYGHLHHASVARVTGATSPDVVVLLTLGTGTGGAVMADGRTVIGAHGFAAEFGHVMVAPDDARLCLCGSTGCLENFASGRGIEELAELDPPTANTRARLHLALDARVTSKEVVALASFGDGWAIAMLELAGGMLGRAIAMLCITLDPTSVVIGGTFGHAAQQWMMPAATREMTLRWPFPAERRLPKLSVDDIGPYAAALGAALMARASTEVLASSDSHAKESH